MGAVLLDAAAMTEHLPFSRTVIVRMARRGDIPAHKLGGKWVFDPDEVKTAVTAPVDPLRQSARSRARRRA
jgi:excisionase family DNA binding protein